MSVFSGRLTVRRFHLSEDTPPPATAEALHRMTLERLLEFAFKPGGPGTERSAGWVRPDNPLDTDFDRDLNDWQHGSWFCFQLRVDTKTAPAKLLRATVDKKVRAWCVEHGTARAPASVIRDIRDAIKEDLLRGTRPKMKVTEIAWDTASNVVLVGSHSDKTTDEIKQRFFRTFGLRLVVDDRRCRYEGAAQLVGGYALAPHFLLWLWWTTSVHGVTLEHDPTVDVWIDDRVRLDHPTDKSQATLVGENPSASREARAALLAGKLPTEVRIGLRVDDREYIGILKGELLEISGLALPPSHIRLWDRQGLHEDGTPRTTHAKSAPMVAVAFNDRMFLYNEFYEILSRMVERWASMRISSEWLARSLELSDWMTEEPAVRRIVPQ